MLLSASIPYKSFVDINLSQQTRCGQQHLRAEKRAGGGDEEADEIK